LEGEKVFNEHENGGRRDYIDGLWRDVSDEKLEGKVVIRERKRDLTNWIFESWRFQF
jgi:hypothetical protein